LAGGLDTSHQGNGTYYRDAIVFVFGGATINDTTVYNGGVLTVTKGATVSGTLATGNKALINTFRYPISDEDWFDDEPVFSAGAVFESTTVKNGAEFYLDDGAVASSTVVKNNGQVYVYGGCTATSTTVSDWGTVYVYGGGSADEVAVGSCGELHVARGGTATEVVENGGAVEIADGAVVTFAENTFCGLELTSGMATVHSGTVAKSATIRNGSMLVYSGGKVTGELTIAEGGEVSLAVESVVDFDISVVSPGGAALINDWSLVDDAGAYCTITTSETQAVGTYALAGGAAGFDKSITVVTDTDAELGVITVGGELTTEKYIYALGVTDGTLGLTVKLADTEPPVKPVAAADITTATNRNVTVTAAFSNDSAVREYSLDGETWQSYTTGIVMSDNGTVYFRAADEAGNVSDIAEYEVTNIDKVAPEKPVATADVTDPTNQCITVTAAFSDDSTVKQYSLDNRTWQTYTAGVTVCDNGTVYFRAADEAGNVSDVAEYEVTNIDKVAPEKPVATADVTDPTNQCITVTAAFSDDSTVKQYSLDNRTWQTYTAGVTVCENGTVYFRAADTAGNVSDVAEYTVANIDTVAPDAPVAAADITTATTGKVTVTATFSDDSAQKQYSTDQKTWQAYTSGVVFTENGTVYFRGTDKAGNISDVTSYTVSNIIVDDFSTGGTVAPGAEAVFTPKLEAAGLYTVSGTFKTAKGSVTVVDKTGKKVASGSVKNGVVTFKNPLLLDNSNTYKVVVKNTDKKGTTSAYTVELKAKELFTKGDNSDDTLKGAKTLAAGTTANDWVGYGDAVDYYKLGVNTAGGIYDLSLSGVKNNVKLTVYSKSGAKVKTVTASAKKPSIPLADLCLDSGSYAVIEAPKAAKAQNSDYALKFTEKATFNRSNNDWNHAEALTADATFAGALSKAAGGDTVDYCDVSALSNLSFTNTAGKVKVSFFGADMQAVKVAVKVAGGKNKTAAAVSLASGKTDNFTIGTLPGSVKYLKIEAAGKTLNSYTIGKIA
jgi:autotransporter passenger strand-loop-strand repeat protein